MTLHGVLATAITSTTAAFWLGIYASVVSSGVALVSLYGQIFLRVRVVAREAYAVKTKVGRDLIVHLESTLKTMDVPAGAATPVVTVAVINRGRQPVQISTVSRAHSLRDPRSHEVFGDFLEYVPFDLLPGHSQTVVHGKDGGHVPGDLPMRRFFVHDGAGRTHPLHERWQQRVEGVVRKSRAAIPTRRHCLAEAFNGSNVEVCACTR